jgi:CheY-like chemotaxis protein
MNAKILLVEDNENNRYLATFLLEREGFRVITAVNGKQVLELARREQPDLIVLDIQMPEMDGYETAARLRSEPQFAHIPIVGVSSFAMTGDRERAIQAGFTGYVEKPINPDTFGRRVADFLRASKEPVMRILSVDDNEENLYMLESLLRSCGYEVVTAKNGVEALDKLRQQPFDLIISDILMPQMDGFQLCREIKKRDEWKRIPFIFYTATYTEKKDELLGLSLGASRFIIKPAQPEAFAAIIREVIREQKAGRLPVPPPVVEEEEVYLKAYNERLVHKLEQKIEQLEGLSRKLQAELDEKNREIAERQRVEAEKTKLEAQLRQAQKMEALGTLAGGIAHDFNNILTVLVGNLELAQMKLAPEDPLEEFIDQSHQASQRATDLVRQILAFSRQQEQERKVTGLSAIIKEVSKLLRAALPATIEMQSHVASDLPQVLADAGQVHQIVMNLATNAAHAMRERGGMLEIQLSGVLVTSDLVRTVPDLREGRYVKLSVSDTGHGMDAATLERIFEPYFTTKTFGEGTGLGLAVVHGIVKNHDGAIIVYSQPGKGTTFHVYFPAVEQPEAVSAARAAPLPRGNGQRILFVDDELALTEIAGGILRWLGYSVTARTNPAESLVEFRAAPKDFDLVITDLTMPGMTGLELARQLLEIRPDVPVLLATGFGGTLTAESVRQRGIRDLLMKPFTAESIAATVHHVFASDPDS